MEYSPLKQLELRRQTKTGLYLYAYEKKTCREGHVWKKITESRYSPKEFDADVIDHYFSAEMIGRGRLSLSEIRTILLLSPIRLFNE